MLFTFLTSKEGVSRWRTMIPGDVAEVSNCRGMLIMESIRAAFEDEALALARGIFSEYADIFAQLRLRVDGPEVIRANQSSKISELRVYFWESEHNIVDAFEFFLVEDGKSVLSREDLELSLRETLDDVVRRRRESMVK